MSAGHGCDANGVSVARQLDVMGESAEDECVASRARPRL